MAWKILEKDSKRWKGKEYKLYLDVLNIFTKTGKSLGNFDNALAAASKVIENVHILKDKWIIVTVRNKEGDYALTLEKTEKILTSCGGVSLLLFW